MQRASAWQVRPQSVFPLSAYNSLYVLMRLCYEWHSLLRSLLTMGNGNLDRQGVTSVPITEDNQFMKYDLWITTLIFLSLTLATQIISAGLCIFNTATVPIETFVGPMGIYLTNTVGGKYRRESTRMRSYFLGT